MHNTGLCSSTSCSCYIARFTTASTVSRGFCTRVLHINGNHPSNHHTLFEILSHTHYCGYKVAKYGDLGTPSSCKHIKSSNFAISFRGCSREISSSQVEMSGFVWAWYLLHARVACASWGVWGHAPREKIWIFKPFLVRFRG